MVASNDKKDKRKYGPKAGKEVEKTMHEHKHKGKFKSKKQAIAVGLSKARRKGAKVPPPKEDKQHDAPR